MIEQLTTTAALGVLNRMLAREQWARDRLAPFAGRVARFEAPPFALALRIDEGGVFADAERAWSRSSPSAPISRRCRWRSAIRRR